MKNWKNRGGIIMMMTAILSHQGHLGESDLRNLVIFVFGVIAFIIEWEA